MDIRNDISIESKINEAEVCRNMGLHQDAIRIYEMVLAELPPQDAVRRDQYRRQVNLLQKEVERREEVNVGNLSEGDIGILIDQLPAPNDPSSIFDKASAFKEMGLYQQSAAELFRLLEKDFPAEIVVPDLAEILLKLHPPKKTGEEFIRLLEARELNNRKKAVITSLFGREMEKKDHREAAFEIYKAANRLDTRNAEIKKALDAISLTRRRRPRH